MSGPIIIPSDDAAEGVLLPLYRRKLMKLLGLGVTYTTTAAATDVYHLIIDRLADVETPLEALAGQHVYVATGPEAGHQTRVQSTGTHGPLGLLEIARPTTTAVGSGIEIELSGSLPAVSYGLWPSLNDVVNEALDALPIHKDHSFTWVAQQERYDLSGLAWRTFRREDVLDVYPPIPSGMTAAQTQARPISRGCWDVEYDGELPYLQFRDWCANDGETFFVKIRRPASTWILSGGSWGSSTTGLTSDSQSATYDVDTVVNVALPIACARLAGYWTEQTDLMLGAGNEAGALACERRAKRWADKKDTLAFGAALTRLHRGFRGTGAQRAGAR